MRVWLRIFLTGAVIWTPIVFGAVMLRPAGSRYNPVPGLDDLLWAGEFWLAGLAAWAAVAAGIAWLAALALRRSGR